MIDPQETLSAEEFWREKRPSSAPCESLSRDYDAYLRSRIVRLALNLPAGPTGADVVRLPSREAWSWGACNLRDIALDGIVQGVVGEERDGWSIFWNYSAWVGPGAGVLVPTTTWYCSASGGPGTIRTPTERLVATGEVAVVRAWCWRRGISGQGRGVDYYREARVFLWDGRD